MTNSVESTSTRLSLLLKLRDWKNNDSWKQFFDTYHRLMFALARKHGLTPSQSEDAVQDILLAIAQKIEEFDYDPNSSSFKSWLFTISRRRIIDHVRKQSRERRFVIPQSEEVIERLRQESFSHRLPAALAAGEPCSEVCYHRLSEFSEPPHNQDLMELALKSALEELQRLAKPRDFQIFEQCVLQEKKTVEVSRGFGVSIAAIYQIKHRLRNQLMDLMRSKMEQWD